MILRASVSTLFPYTPLFRSDFCGPPKGGSSAPEVHLLKALVLLFLLPDVVPYHFCVPPHCGYEVPPRPEMLAYEVPLLFSVYASQVNCTLPLDKPDHLRHCVLWRDRDQHVHVV